jgi:hypothetical protein
VDQDDASKLSDAHWLALRLDDAGLDAGLIARVLGIEDVAVNPLLDVARRKRAAVTPGPKETS